MDENRKNWSLIGYIEQKQEFEVRLSKNISS